MRIEPVREDEHDHLLDIAVQTGLFTRDEAAGLLGAILAQSSAGELPEGHTAVACRISSAAPAVGWAYFAPDPYADRVWDLWWIGVLPDHHGGGAARALLSYVERAAAAAGARLLIIETSDQALLARARRFYERAGYLERGRIPQFYAEHEAKVIFSRNITGGAE